MKRLGIVVEGLGDRKAFPAIIAKTGILFGKQIFVRKAVEGGEWSKLKKEGVLEKYCRLVAADECVDEILVAVDLDDGCVVDEVTLIAERLGEISELINLPVSICFCVREFETWFLECLEELRESGSDVGWKDRQIPEFPLSIRGAKEEFEQHLGAKYRPSVDQEKFAKRLDLKFLTQKSRSYRKFVRATTGLNYEEIFEVVL